MAGVAEVPAGERERRAVGRLLRFYPPDTPRWRRPTGAAWQLALAIEAVAGAYGREADARYRQALDRWHRRHRVRRSRFFDDDGWYVNAWLSAYDVTGDPAFLASARAGFADLLPGWDDTFGGGLWWNRDRGYKNAITTGLFLLAAARLARRCPDADYLDQATRAWAWFDHSGLINVDGLVNDGLTAEGRNNGGVTWTYNQGVLVGALAELSRVSGDPSLLARAGTVADAALARLTDADGILHEPCEATGCDRDQEVFKGVFAQGLVGLYDVGNRRPAYQRFLRTNADSLWHRGRSADDGLGLNWSGPPDVVTPATQLAGTLLLGAVAHLDSAPER